MMDDFVFYLFATQQNKVEFLFSEGD